MAAKPENLGVVFEGRGKVKVVSLPYPDLRLECPEQTRDCPHAVIVKVVASCICGSDLHMVHGRTAAPTGIRLGHEITGEVVEVGSSVEWVKVGDIVSVPFNIACGSCPQCNRGNTNGCLRVNPKVAGGAYGYVDMGGWHGGQSRYCMVPYADFNCLIIPNTDVARAHIQDISLLADIFPTGFHGAVTAGVGVGSTVYIAGAGPVGLACAVSAQLLGAAEVMVGDLNPERLAQVKKAGFTPIDVASKTHTVAEQVERHLGEKVVDCAVDCVGYEAHGEGGDAGRERPAAVLDACIRLTRHSGGIGVAGVYVPTDPGAAGDAVTGRLSVGFGEAWSKSQTFVTGQCPVKRYNAKLLRCILAGRAPIAAAVGAEVIPLERACEGYAAFDGGAAKKFILDPHGIVAEWSARA